MRRACHARAGSLTAAAAALRFCSSAAHTSKWEAHSGNRFIRVSDTVCVTWHSLSVRSATSRFACVCVLTLQSQFLHVFRERIRFLCMLRRGVCRRRLLRVESCE